MRSKFKWIFTLLVAFTMQFSFAQQKTVTGTVTSDGVKLPGATVSISGTKQGTQTDENGKFSIKAAEGDVLEVSFLNKETKKVTVGAGNVINVTLSTIDNVIKEVVIAYGKTDKRKIPSAQKTISGSAITDAVALSPQELLQGQVAGVQVVGSSGVLGSGITVKVRGVQSINSGGRPLFVIDGVPMNDNINTTAQGGQGLNPLMEINQNDIESMTVLKDASATALYGSRGANGVVLVTTKKGKKGDTKVVFDQTVSSTSATDKYGIMTADQFRSFLTAKGLNPATFGNESFDWQDAMSREGTSTETNLSVSGGSDKTTFHLGFGRADQVGFIVGNNLERTSGKLSITHNTGKKISVGGNISVSEVKNDRVGSENSTFAPFTSAFLQTPWVTPYDASGNFVNTGFIANVLAIETLDINQANSTRVFGNVFGEYEFIKGLKYKADFGIDRLNLEQIERSFEINSPGGYGYLNLSAQNKYVVTNTLNFERTFKDKHNIGLLLGSSYEQSENRMAQLEGTDYLSDALLNIASAATKTTTTSDVDEYRLNGYFARLNYDYDKRYVIDISARRDGTSRFGQDSRYGKFWSIGAVWNAKNESFLQDINLISDLRLRASIGTNGNDRVGDYRYFPIYTGGTDGAYNGESGNYYSQPANNEYRWEQSRNENIGLDIIINKRINLIIDAYRKTTTDMILNPPIPATNGFQTITGNSGSMENKGLEFDLSTENIKTKNFSWNTSFNISFNKNTVLSLPGASVDLDGNRFVSGGNNQRAIEGYSVNTFFLIKYLGIDPNTGDAMWADKNGNPTKTPTANDRVIVGDANPDFTGGLTNTFKYKNLDLSIFANFSYGNDIYVDGLRFTENIASNTFNKSTDLLDYWTTPGQTAYAPKLTSTTANSFNQRSSAQLRDGSFIRLKNVTLGYNLPSDIFKNNNFISGARIYFTASNLLTIKDRYLGGIDPETTSTIGNLGQGETFFTPPQSKTYLMGVRLSF